jgi:hypothetical protein
MFACPRDSGANALRLRFRESTSSEASEAPITHSRNTALYRVRAAERKAYRMANVTRGPSASQGLFSVGRCNASLTSHVNVTALADGRRSVLSQREKKTQ